MLNSKTTFLKPFRAIGLVFFVIIIAIFLFGKSGIVYAQDSNNLLWGGQQTNTQTALGLGSEDIRVVIARVIQIFLGFLGIIAVVLIMYAGWLWMTSQGRADQIERARKILINAAIGLLIILSSFGIVSFIISRLLVATGGAGTTTGPGAGGAGIGLGALGECSISSVYPAPNATDVPRNTSIIVTFKEAVKPETIIDPANPGKILQDGRIKIYKRDSDPSTFVTDVSVSASPDNKTFIFVPKDYLGSPSEVIWYSVYLSNDIEKTDGKGIFSTCRSDYFVWSFEVSNKIDLTPPQVEKQGVFPIPDNEKDNVSASVGIQAKGSVVVASQPSTGSIAKVVSVNKNPASAPWSAASATIGVSCSASGIIKVGVKAGDLQATLEQGGRLLGSGIVDDNSITYSFCNFKITLSSGSVSSNCLASGCVWDVNVSPTVPADSLTVGNITYTFVSASPAANQILIGAGINQTAGNIASALSSNSQIFAAVDLAIANKVNITAINAGEAGNNIVFKSNSVKLILSPTSGYLSGGEDEAESVTIKDKKDKPRNSVIQVNFNEAVIPTLVSGDAQSVANYIGVKCITENGAPCNVSNPNYFACGSDICLKGSFVISNQYKTVEFISNNLCGVNGCGEKIYCLPENSNLRVDVQAAALEGCVNCQAKTPYTECVNGHCYDNTALKNHPLASSPLSGIADAALNSLDGNRDNEAVGPIGFFNENNSLGEGDNYQWSFYISSILDLTPPEITQTLPINNTSNISLEDPMLINFNKVMMSSSLNPGSTIINNGEEEIEHMLINLRNFSNLPVGYWVVKKNIDDNPTDGEPDWTQAEVDHSTFTETASFRAQVGSGVKDIYQNCFKPSKGPACPGVNATSPTCCSGTVSSESTCPQ